MCVILALWRWRREDEKFKVILRYVSSRPALSQEREKHTERYTYRERQNKRERATERWGGGWES